MVGSAIGQISGQNTDIVVLNDGSLKVSTIMPGEFKALAKTKSYTKEFSFVIAERFADSASLEVPTSIKAGSCVEGKIIFKHKYAATARIDSDKDLERRKFEIFSKSID